MCVELQHFT